jgi:uncharacterized protein
MPITDKEKKIIKFMELMQIRDLPKMMFQHMFEAAKQMSPEEATIPENFAEDFCDIIPFGDIFDLFIPVYSKYYPDEYLDDIIELMENPAYQKLQEVLPLMQTEINVITQRWIENHREEIEPKIAEVFEKYKM